MILNLGMFCFKQQENKRYTRNTDLQQNSIFQCIKEPRQQSKKVEHKKTFRTDTFHEGLIFRAHRDV